MKPLRPHQAKALSLLRQSIAAGRRRPMLQAPTGAGKTRLAAEIIASAVAKGKRVIFTVPAVSLVDQTAREFYAEGVRDVGVMQADHPMTDASKPVQIASIQTLMRRQLPKADLVIVDEAHRVFSFVEQWMCRDEWLSVPFIGLSATPWTKGLGRLYDQLIVAATLQELIEAGYLSPFRVFAPSHPDLSGVRTVAGDYHEGDLSDAMGKGTLTADIVSTWLEHGERRPTLCFAVDRAHAAALQAQFQASGVRCGYVDCNTPREERGAVEKAFRRRQLDVVCNVGVLTTGVDWDVRCIILARPTKSEMLYVQIVGRGLRIAEGKQDCLVLDHSDNTIRLGFVTDIHKPELCDGTLAKVQTRENEPPLPKGCPKCKRLRPPKVAECPSCGFKPEKQSAVEVQQGELVELDARRRKVNKELTWPEKVRFFGELQGYANQHGYKPGWAAMKYREKTGVWPNDPRLKAARAVAVGAETANWIRSRQIAFAKARAS